MNCYVSPNRTYTVKECANILGKNPETIRRWCRSGKLKASYLSKKEGYYITESELNMLVANNALVNTVNKRRAQEIAALQNRLDVITKQIAALQNQVTTLRNRVNAWEG